MNQIDSSAKLASLARWRAGFIIAAVALPAVLYLLFERQAVLLDDLAADGQPVLAHVTSVSEANQITYYAYEVDGAEYTWNVNTDELPYREGEAFQAMYLPHDPSFSRPIADRSLASLEGAKNRSFGSKLTIGIGLFFVFLTAVITRDIERLRSGTPAEPVTPEAYRRRLGLTLGFIIVPLILLVSGWHLNDAMQHGQSIWPVVVAALLPLAILGGLFFVAGREGPALAQVRSNSIIQRLVPFVVLIGILRMIALFFGH